ncbi:MAG: type VI secretion system domain-containing protein [Chitinivibrionales bacterium]|nr:type VI secretion system domain-containing protein [Chitinivibrionales bacterium]
MIDIELTTPHGAVGTAIKALKDSLITMSTLCDMAVYTERIEKIISYLEMMHPYLPDTTGYIQSDSKIQQHFSGYFPVEELLKPVTDESPCGKDIRSSDEYAALIDCIENRLSVDDFMPHYRDAEEKAMEILRTCSKDISVVVRLVEAGVQTGGFKAVADGLLLMTGLLSKYWDCFFSEVSMDDKDNRFNEIAKLQEVILTGLPSHYGQPDQFKPLYADRETAQNEKKDVDNMLFGFSQFEELLSRRLPDLAPQFQLLATTLQAFHTQVTKAFTEYSNKNEENIDPHFVPFEIVLDDELATTKNDETMTEIVAEGASQPVESTAIEKDNNVDLKPETKKPMSVDDAYRQIDRCAEFLIHALPHEPLGYCINRCRRWFSLESDGHESLPSSQDRTMIEQLYTTGQWKELLCTAEAIFVRGGHYWLDLQRYSVEAAQKLGTLYDCLADMLLKQTRVMISSNETLITKQFSDFTAAASAQTQQWLHELKQVQHESPQILEIVSSENKDVYEQELAKARSIAQQGDVNEAIRIIRSRFLECRSERERFLWQLNLAELCLSLEKGKISCAIADDLVSRVEQHRIDQWEDGDLLGRLYKTGYEAYFSVYGIQKVPKEKIDFYYNRLCLVNPEYFINK